MMKTRSIIAVLAFAAAAQLASAGDKYWVGGASGNWSGDNWADASGGAGGAWVDGSKAIFDGGSVTVSGASALNVAEIENTGAGSVTFLCPVQFSGTYYVVQNGIVCFPGGATATFPDNALRTASATANTLTLRGDFTFTADWSVNDVGDYPWVVAAGSTVHGQGLTGSQTSGSRILRVEEGGSACFTAIALGTNLGGIDVDGWLEASGDITVDASSHFNFGRDGNFGTVKADCIKKVSGNYAVYSRIPNLIVGEGGLGLAIKDYFWQFMQDRKSVV